MATTGQLIARLFPAGTRLLGRGRGLCRLATRPIRCGRKRREPISLLRETSVLPNDAFFSDDYRKRVARIARQWTKLYASGKRGVPRRLQNYGM